MFQLTAPGVTGPGRAVPNHVVEGLRMGLGPFLSLPSMEARNVKDLQLAHRAVIPMRVLKSLVKVSYEA